MNRTYPFPAASEVTRKLVQNRREFLRASAHLALGGALLGGRSVARAGVAPKKRKVVVITFGGGARDQETFAPEGQENIPHLIRELIPQQTLCDHDHASDEQCQTRKDPQIAVAVHNATLVQIKIELPNTEHPPTSSTGGHTAAKQ